MALQIVILAAGVGKRMRSSLPKVLHPLAGRPLLAHVLDTARALNARRIVVVHGHTITNSVEVTPNRIGIDGNQEVGHFFVSKSGGKGRQDCRSRRDCR